MICAWKKETVFKILAIAMLLFCLVMMKKSAVLVQAAEANSNYNILLIGSDRRDETWNGNSDVMCMVTVRQDTNQLILTSFMRDLYADIPGHGVHKLNYAYAIQGPELLKQTLEQNYQIKIDNYASVDFNSMADIVDMLGGVELYLNEAECEIVGVAFNASDVNADGKCRCFLNGAQAVTYARIRKVGNNDYERTQRQRNVLGSIFDSFQSSSAAELQGLVPQVMEKISHDLSSADVLRLLSLVPAVNAYELVENRIPYDGLYHSDNEMLVPDWDATIGRLHEILYQ